MKEDVYSQEEAKYLKVGIYAAFLIALIACVYVLNKDSMAHKEDGKYYTIDARFNRTDGLLVGDIGSVSSSQLHSRTPSATP